jgi:Predicted Na+-dependent transporter
MEALKQIIPILLTMSLWGLVLTVGLKSVRGDLIYVLTRPWLLLKAIVAVDVIPITAALLLTLFLPLEPVVKAGIVLMAISPVPPLVPGQELGLGGRKQYAYGVYVAMALLAVVAVPLANDVAARAFGRQDTPTFLLVAKSVIMGVVIPLLVGMTVRLVAPAVAARLAPWVYRLSMLLVFAAFLPILVSIWPEMTRLVGNGTVLVMAAVTAIGLAGGHLLGGPDLRDRATLAIASSIRHPGIAMMLANAHFMDKRVTAAVFLFLLVGMAVGIPYRMWIKRSMPQTTAQEAV